jgi:hypothetical protein
LKLVEILIILLAGLWQGISQDFNLLEMALVASAWWAWKPGWHPRWPAWLLIPKTGASARLAALAVVTGFIGLRLALLAMRIGAQLAGLFYKQELNTQSWCCLPQGDQDKPRISAQLANTPGTHLVFVRAKTDPHNLYQWIYNGADLNSSRLVWARDLGNQENARLAAYMTGRRVWMVNPNVQPATLTDYLPATLQSSLQSSPLPSRSILR